MKWTTAVIFAFALTCLYGCNGASGDNGDDPFGSGGGQTTPEISLTLEILDASCAQSSAASVELGTELCISATLTQDGQPVTNTIVGFTSSLGSLAVSEKLTNNNGVAQVALTSMSANIGAGQITASYNDASAQQVFEYVSPAEVVIQNPTISIGLTNNTGLSVVRFPANESITATAQLLDAQQQPISNAILNFAISRGTLSTTQALTNINGIASVSLSGASDNLGAGTLTVSLNSSEQSAASAINYEIITPDTAAPDVILGSYVGGIFVEGVLGIDGYDSTQDVTVSAGGTLGLQLALVDSQLNPIVNAIPVAFSSTCSSDGRANIDEQVYAVNGVAQATYEDLQCAGSNGNNDVISATVTVNNTTQTLTRVISLSPESVGSIAFVSADPQQIVLQGSSGVNASTVSTVSFVVRSALGNPLAQQTVSFSLNTEVGGLNLANLSGITNSQGMVSTRVNSGTVPTSVRVTASVALEGGETLSTQSELLTVNTGLPDQNSITLAAENLNPEAADIVGQSVDIYAYLADASNNPVPDGTAVSFTTEGGQIEPQCTTVAGYCSVVWTSTNPIPSDHRVTLLATAIGHETLADGNGNNAYDDNDGGPITTDGSGFDLTLPQQSGFVDLPEAWLDANEDRQWSSDEPFLDFDSSGDYSAANQRFDGPHCNATQCGSNSVHVRRALVLIASSSAAIMEFLVDGAPIADNRLPPSATPVVSLARGASVALQLRFQDTAGQPVASSSSLSVTSSSGTLAGTTSGLTIESNWAGAQTISFILTNSLAADDEPTDALLSAEIISPSGVISTLQTVVRLN